MQLIDLVNRVRQEIGDPPQPFNTIQKGDGQVAWFNLPKSHISETGFTVQETNGVSVDVLTLNVDYTVNYDLGELSLSAPVPNGETLIVSGTAYSLFSDTDLQVHIADGIRSHVYDTESTERYQTADGWITYRQVPVVLENLPRIQEPLIIMRCAIYALWNLANDIATDMNVQTAEGTNIDHGELYNRMMAHITALTDRYKQDCAMLNVGPYSITVLHQRRVSQTTGRLVPIFTDREFDDHRYPTRELPPIDSRDQDSSGIPSQLYLGGPV